MKRIVAQEANGQYPNDDEIVALAMTTLNKATTVREYLLQLADMRNTLEQVQRERLAAPTAPISNVIAFRGKPADGCER